MPAHRRPWRQRRRAGRRLPRRPAGTRTGPSRSAATPRGQEGRLQAGQGQLLRAGEVVDLAQVGASLLGGKDRIQRGCMSSRRRSVVVPAGKRSGGRAQPSTLPGFISPSGSRACLMARCRRSSTGLLSRAFSSRRSWPRPCSAEMEPLVPVHQVMVMWCTSCWRARNAWWASPAGRHVEVQVAVAQVTEDDQPAARMRRLQRGLGPRRRKGPGCRRAGRCRA